MAYEPKTWESGEVVTADALNHLEQGVANAGGSDNTFIVTFAPSDPYTPDKTFAELVQAVDDGKAVFATRDGSEGRGFAILQYQLVNINPKNGNSSFADFSFCGANSNGTAYIDSIHWVKDGTITINHKSIS